MPRVPTGTQHTKMITSHRPPEMTAVATPHVGATQLRARLRRGCVQRATRASTRTRRPSRLIARASEGAPADDAAAAAEEEVGIDDLVELEIGGVSVSPRGFVALLVPKGSAGSIPRAPNPVEELRRAEPRVPLGSLRTAQTLPLLISNRPEDREGAASEWAQAMLQLTQDPPIDMGIQLPYGALDELTGAEGSILGAVFLGEARWDETGTRYVFESTLLAGKDLDQSTYALRGGEDEAWRALALALRYAPYGCRLFATRKALAAVDARAFGGAAEESAHLDGGGLSFANLRDAFPMLQTTKEARAIAAEARKRYLLDPFMAASGAGASEDEEDGGYVDDDDDGGGTFST